MDYRTTISDIFSTRKNCFAVPNFQRAYSWEVGSDLDKQVPQFLKDLKEHPISVPQYHLGHFLFEQDKINKNKFWIIDGQQRMSTTVILMSCIYERLKKELGYEKDAENIYHEYLKNTDDQQKFCTVDYDNNYFLNIVIDKREDKADTKSRKRINEAKAYFQKEIENATLENVLHWKSLIENAKITTDTVEDKAEATQIFTFQNDRGKDLTDLEKLKAFLMLKIYLSSKTTDSDPNSAIEFVDKEFETIYKSLEKINIANEDQILNYHTTAFIALSGTSIDRIKSAFNKVQDTQHQKWIKDFAVNLKRTFEFAISVQELRSQHSSIPDILHLDMPNSFPLLIKLFHFKKIDNEIEKVFRIIEIILFKCKYTIGNYYTNYLPNLALEYNGDNNWLNKSLMQYAKFGFKHYWNFDGDFHKRLEGDNHYFSLTRYLLWKYENHLRKEVKEAPILYPEFSNLYGVNQKLENTIDHWTPQKPEDLEYGQEFNEKYLNNIGNMVLSTRSRNASDSNNLPDNRSTVSILISRQRLEPFKGNWGKDKIIERQKEIVVFAKEYWNPENLK